MTDFCEKWKGSFEEELDDFRDYLDELDIKSPEVIAGYMANVTWVLPDPCIVNTPVRLNLSGETLENGMWLQNRGAVFAGFIIEFDIEANGVIVPICPSLLGDEQYSKVTGSYGHYEQINRQEIYVKQEPFMPKIEYVNSRLWGLYKKYNHNQIEGILPQSRDGAVVLEIFLESLSKSLGETIVLKGLDSFIDDAVSVFPTINKCWENTAELITQS
ncbi:MAG: hypothetical protein RLZZ330_199 [Actinomycetota bacterium]|jgi:hypothetical protein